MHKEGASAKPCWQNTFCVPYIGPYLESPPKLRCRSFIYFERWRTNLLSPAKITPWTSFNNIYHTKIRLEMTYSRVGISKHDEIYITMARYHRQLIKIIYRVQIKLFRVVRIKSSPHCVPKREATPWCRDRSRQRQWYGRASAAP
jgi:hypothetical protein